MGTSDTIPPDEQALQKVQAAAAADNPSFATGQEINGVRFGLVGDGRTDNTESFAKLLAGGNRTVRIPAGDYVTSAIHVASKTILILDRGVIIRDAGRLQLRERLLNIVKVHDVRIIGAGARIIADRQHYRSGEQRHGVIIFGAQRITIDGVESSGHGGDGFYVSSPAGAPSSDVILRNCAAANNRRQGLSITSARRVRIIDCAFTGTNGTAPQAGLDLEPNRPGDVLEDIVILRLHTERNRGGGILINLHTLDAGSAPVDVSLIAHTSEQEYARVRTRVPTTVKAILRYSEARPTQ